MTKEINLLPKPQGPDRIGQINYWSVRIVGMLVSLFIIVVLGTLGGNILVSREASALDTQIQQSKQIIQSKQEEEELYVALVNKLQIITSTTNARFPYYTFMTTLRQLSGDAIHIDGVQFYIDGTITLNVLSRTSSDLDTFIKKLIDSSSAKTYVVELKSTSRNNDGSYAVTLDFSKSKPLSSLSTQPLPTDSAITGKPK